MKILRWVLCILTILSTLVMLFILPDTVPVHFDIAGMADRWGSKYELLILPFALIACAFSAEPFSRLYTKKADSTDNEKEKAEHLSNAKVIKITVNVTLLLFFVMNIVTLYSTYTYVNPDAALPEFDMIRVVSVIMGLTIIVLGNYMPKTRNNKNIGFRLPWTQYNDTTWRKSNRFASYVLMIAGVITVLLSILNVDSVFVVATFLVALALIIVYAYIIYSLEKKKDDQANNKK